MRQGRDRRGRQAHVAQLYLPIEPYEHGLLDVGEGHQLYWEQCGDPEGKPALVLHGGPGSGATPSWRRYFDPSRYRIVLFDQRGCGRSSPHAGDTLRALEANTTPHLVADIEQLRARLGVERWLLLAGSWGVTLGLAYAEAHPERVSEAVFFSVTSGSRREIDWITRQAGRFFPDSWAKFRDGAQSADPDGDLADAYARLLADPDPHVCETAARNWCAWEDAHVAVRPGRRPSPRYEDPRFRLGFARLVTHYWRHQCFVEDGALLRDVQRLSGIPGVLIHGRLDLSSPPDIAWELSRRWPGSELMLLDDAGHGSGEPGVAERIVETTDRFARDSQALP
jgi:proline iminopeptidase